MFDISDYALIIHHVDYTISILFLLLIQMQKQFSYNTIIRIINDCLLFSNYSTN